MKLRLGTRGSELALVQSELVAERLRRAGHEVEVIRIVTEGDLRPVDMSPGEGVFVAAIARALLAAEVDLAVHSAKDVPLEEEPELVIAAYPERADPRDALVTREGGKTLTTLPLGTVVGTDSPRRTGFLRAARPDLRVVPLHGNVDTRLRKLDRGEVGALVLAAAGLDRLGRSERVDARLEAETIAPAPAQGALAIQVRRKDLAVVAALAALDVAAVRLAVEAERAVLTGTGGTCRAPVGALAAIAGDTFLLLAAGVNSDGSDMQIVRARGTAATSASIGLALGRRLAELVELR
ncbi:MAG: hydroxymethylbilane synthase [Candidatus Dormibacteraceae bacterium]